MLLLIITVLLRIPSLFEPHYYGDEEIYFVMGRAWREGWMLYRDIFDHKPQLIYIFAGLFESVFAFRLVLLIWEAVHTALFWLLARKIFDGSRKALVFISTLLFVILNSAPFLEGQIANGELFMMMPVTAAALILWSAKKKQYKRFLVAGILAGIGLLFKVPVVTDFAALVLFFWFFREKKVINMLKNLAQPGLWLIVIGFLLPVGASITYYASQGVLSDYVNTALLVNFGYVSSWQTSSYTFNPLASGLFIRTAVLGIYTLMLFGLRHRLKKEFVFAALWFGFSLYGSLLSGRPYPHYLLQPAVPAALLMPFMFITESVMGWIVIAVIITLAVLTQKTIGFWHYPSMPYFQHFWDRVSGRISTQEYIQRFDGTKRNYAVAKYLQERMRNGDQLFIWGSDPTVYNLLGKLPTGGKYIVSFHVRDLKEWDLVMENLEKNQPKFVVVNPDPIPFPEFFQWLKLNYIEVREIEGASIYLRF